MFDIFDKNKKDYNVPSRVPNAGEKNKSVLILTTDGVQDLEFFYPFYRLVEEGYNVDVATPDGEKFEGKYGMGLQQTRSCKEITPENYDLLYIPGGKAPAALRRHEECISITQRFASTGKPIAAICHGPQLLISAGLVRGKRIAAWPEVKKEVVDAGGIYADEPAALDGQFITGRWPGDLPAFMQVVLTALKKTAAHEPQRAA